MNLFARLYLDEDVSALVAALLRVRGFDVTTARDEDMLGKGDAEQLSRAVTLQRCIVTHNRVHFERLHSEYLSAGNRHCGIILASRRSPHAIASRLGVLLNTLTADEFENQLFYI